MISGSSVRQAGVASIDGSLQGFSKLSFVSIGADFAWQILKSQQDRDDNIRILLMTIADLLGFMDAVDVLPKIQKLQDTVSSIMEQIQECALFIEQYCENGLLSGYR